MKETGLLFAFGSIFLLTLQPAFAEGDGERRISNVVNGVLAANPDLYYKFDAKPLRERMDFYHTPGVSIAVINHGRIEWARGFGVAERDRTNPVTETTLFQAASISKPVFALAVMRLVQDGKLDLDTDVNQYLKSWKVPGQRQVTLRQILGHTAGFTVHGFDGYARTASLPTLVQILDGEPPANSSPVRVTFTPGSQFRYSGGGVEVAQQVVLDVTGEPFPEFMHAQVLAPLGMGHSTYEQPLPEGLQPFAATGYGTDYREIEGHWHVYSEMAAAGLWTTPSDLALLGLELQARLRFRFGAATSPEAKSATDTLWPSRVIEEMLKPGLGGVGISFFISGSGKTARFGHGGANAGFRSQMTFYEHEGLGCVVMVNSDEGGALIPEIERAVAREYNWPDYFPKERTEIAVDPKSYDGLVGQYSCARNGTPVMVVHRRADRLMGRLFGQPDREMFPEGETNFFFKSIDAQIGFESDRDGSATALELHWNGEDLAFKKFSATPFWGHKALTAADCEPTPGSRLQGTWRGTLKLGAQTLNLVVRIAEPSANKYNAELDSVDQNANGQVLSVICNGGEVKLVVMPGYGMFAGEISSDDKAMTGDWIQGGASLPLTLRRP